MASKFAFPDWAFDDLPSPAPAPPPSPQEVEANDARVNDLKNDFIDAKQRVLFTAPQAFLRRRGADAIVGAEDASGTLTELRRLTLDQAANAHQRERLAEMLDWHLADANDEIHRHVAGQSDAWQQGVAARTVELATRQAALESSDSEKVGFLALAAYDAGKARALKAGLPPEAAHENGRIAWSGAYEAAIATQAEKDPPSAVKLFRQAQSTLDPQTREALAPRMEAISRDAEAAALVDKALAPGADRKTLLEDPSISQAVKLIAEAKIANRETAAAALRRSRIDALDHRLLGETPQALAKASYVPGTYATIANGYAAAGDAGKAADARRLAESETLLTGFATATPANQALMLAKLEPGEVRDQALRVKDTTDRMLASDPLRWGATTQRTNGVGELTPLDLLPSPTNTPQVIGDALAKREQQARQSEALAGHPTLVMTKDEVAALKTALDAAPLESKQKMLRTLAGGLSNGAIARLALELAKQGPLADGYAVALSTYGAKSPQQDALADRILDGLDRMKAAGEGGRPIADTGPEWRRAFDERVAGGSSYFDEKNAAALRAATAALYVQSTALLGKDTKAVDGAELDVAIREVRGASAERASPIGKIGPVATGQPGPNTAFEKPPTVEGGPDQVETARLDDGTRLITRNNVETLYGKANLTAAYDDKSRLTSMNATFADGHRVESRWSYTGETSRSQIDTVRNAQGDLLGTITTTFDGARFTRVIEPPAGPSQTRTWDRDGPVPTVQQVQFIEPAVGAYLLFELISAAIEALSLYIIGKTAERALSQPEDTTAAEAPPNANHGTATELLPSYWEMLIGEYTDGAKITAYYDKTEKEVSEICPSFPDFAKLALEGAALARSMGLKNGLAYGNAVHAYVADRLRKRRFHEVMPEAVLLNGVLQRNSFTRPKGSSAIDIFEILSDGTVCIYDIKTGKAKFGKPTMDRYGDEVWQYLAYMKMLGTHKRVVVMPIRVP